MQLNTNDYLLKEECYEIIGACMEVANELGCGFFESVYQEALSIEFSEKGIPFEKEKVLDIYYKDRLLNKKYIADFVCFDQVIVELKAIETFHPEHTAQVLNYLKATGKKVGLLINFGNPKLQYKRIIL
ncbi:MAG: GxxExxY protein [Prolixibacteraceae bacterium]